NKTLCYVDENRAKGDKTPFQFYGSNTKKWEEVKARAFKLLPPQKYKVFVREEINALDDFVSRQLNDTRYISRKAKEYLYAVCKKTYVTTGMLTYELRHYWGLNSILNPDKNVKSRDDHRHHAVDALVVAATRNNHLMELSKWNKFQKLKNGIPNHKFKEPWDGFFEDAKESISGILVSYKNRHRILSVRNYKSKKEGREFVNKGVSARGALHEETVYGKRQDQDGNYFYAVRKPLVSLTPAMIASKIVDHSVKMLIWDRLRKFGVDPTKKFEMPKDVFVEPIYLPNKNGDPVPIRKVRIRENFSNILQLKTDVNQWVEPGSNFLVAIYEDKMGEKSEEIVTFFEAARRKQAKRPIVEKTKKDERKLIATLQINDNFILGLNESNIDWDNIDFKVVSENLYRVQKLSTYYYTFRKHLASTLEHKEDELSIRNFGDGKTGWLTLSPIKVRITPTGKIEKIT
ncbi:hypothetical protein JNM05_08990, partial [bacterium]|nr:hypothetical protein [bacterium]